MTSLDWALLAIVLLVVIATMFVHDFRRARRGEPIRTLWFPNPIYPDSPFYLIALVRVFAPYATVFGIVAILAALVIFVMVRS